MLKIEKINVFYGDLQVLKEVSMEVEEGKIVVVIGANGAGKSTLINTISGLLVPRQGQIIYQGTKISDLSPHKIVAKQIIQVPEGRQLFTDLTIQENLLMGAYLLKSKDETNSRMNSVYELFPILKERSLQKAGTLSGGEQQMLAVSRALMANPKLLMFDEPSLGLAPKMVKTIFEIIVKINKQLGVSVLLVEQNVKLSCQICDHAYVMENGTVTLSGTGAYMLGNQKVRQAYLGL